MTAVVNCPCCKRPWRAAPRDRLSLFAVRRLALDYVKRETGVTERELMSGSRKRHLVEARALFVWIAKTYCPADASYERIGLWIDKDHGTIRNQWLKVIPELRAKSADFTALCAGFLQFALDNRENLTWQ